MSSYNIILFINENNITFTKTSCYFFVNTKFFVSVNKRRCIILFFLLRRIILHLQKQRVTFRKCKVTILHKYKSSYNVILIKKNNIFTRTKSSIFTNVNHCIIIFFLLMKIKLYLRKTKCYFSQTNFFV